MTMLYKISVVLGRLLFVLPFVLMIPLYAVAAVLELLLTSGRAHSLDPRN